jgi:hypothetical protein
MLSAAKYAANASVASHLRQQDAASASAGLPPSGQWAGINEEARRAASEIQVAQRRVNELIARTVGFHRVYAARPIESSALRDDRATGEVRHG